MSQEGIVPAGAACKTAPRGWIARGEPARAKRAVVSRIFASWNQLGGWLRQIEALREVP